MAGKGKKKSAGKAAPGKISFSVDECDMLYNAERFKILFEESLDAVYLVNRDGILMDLNRAGCELLGYQVDEIIGQNIESAYVRKEDRKQLLNAIASNDRVRDFEVALKKKDGTQLICLITAFVRRSPSGEVLGYQGIIRDITDSRQLELSLKAEYERAEFYNDLMSHDINNFNQGAMSNLELLLLSGELSEKSERYVKNALDQITGSANLISNLRKLQAIKSGEIVAQTVDVLELLEDAVLSSRALFPGKEIEIKIASETEDAIVVGSRLLFEAFVNLITNAIKFNRSKDIQIVVCVSGHESGFLKLEFMDNGPGVEDSMKEKIFDRSLRLHPEIWGTGLGLTLVKTIVESFGGCIYVENRVKNDHTHGSNFIVILRRGN
jgi:PAS domain S-box-containing protein